MRERKVVLNVVREFSRKKHAGQKDKGGNDYFENHIFSVVAGVDTAKQKIVAYLHDVLEDTDATENDLIRLGLADDVIEAIKLLTKTDDDLTGYYNRIRENDLARIVKLSDLENNMDLSRVKNVTIRDMKRTDKYIKWYDYLMR